MTQLTGTFALARFAARRDRRLIAGCVVALVLVVLASSSSLKGLYPTAADRAKVAATLEGQPGGRSPCAARRAGSTRSAA